MFFLIWLGCAPVLVDHTAEDSVASDRGAEGDWGGGVVGWRVLIQALVRAVVIEMAHVPAKNSSGVSLVVAQHPVAAFGAGRCPRTVPHSSSPGGSTGRDLHNVDAFGGNIVELGTEGEDRIRAGEPYRNPTITPYTSAVRTASRHTCARPDPRAARTGTAIRLCRRIGMGQRMPE